MLYREEMLYELLGLVDENAVNQWITKNGWKPNETGYILISNQEENIKTKKITEKIDLESVAGIIASSFWKAFRTQFCLPINNINKFIHSAYLFDHTVQ